MRAPTLLATLAYLALTLVATWPLAAGLGRDVPADLGDPLLNIWILDWVVTGLGQMLVGGMSFTDLWQANIFHPEPLALSYSEHLVAQALQIAPIALLTDNRLLAYDLLFLSTYVIAGIGMYLLARDLTGRGDAAFVAGAIFAFAPLRLAQISHVQTLSTGWMPLALWGLRRFVLAGRPTALVAGTAALVLVGWSSGYFLIFFVPLVPVFLLHQMWAGERLTTRRVWVGLIAAAVIVTAANAPFLAMYRQHAVERPLGEIAGYSADLAGYLTAPEMSWLWGTRLRLAPRSEGEVFFGLVALLLAIAGLVTTLVAAWRSRTAAPRDTPPRRAIVTLLAAAGGLQLAALAGVLATGGFVFTLAGLTLRANAIDRLLLSLLVIGGMALVVSARARVVASALARSWIAVAALLAIVAMWLSLGPRPTTMGDAIAGLPVYRLLVDAVPGFNGLRVPARYAMVALCFLCPIAAAGHAALVRPTRRAFAVAVIVTALIAAEGVAAPFPVNATWGDGPVVPPSRVETPGRAPAVYHAVAALPADTVLLEFPFGDAAWELRYVYYATIHHRRLVNGYSGGFPPSYSTRAAALGRRDEDPARAWQALTAAGTTHVVRHGAALLPAERQALDAWLTAHGARVVQRFAAEDDLLYAVPPSLAPR